MNRIDLIALPVFAFCMNLQVNAITPDSNNQQFLGSHKVSDTSDYTDHSLRSDTLPKKSSVIQTALQHIDISGVLHLRYQGFQDKDEVNGFDIRRVLITINGNVTPYLGYKTLINFAGRPALVDAYAEFMLNDYFKLTAGQFKIPLSQENLTALTDLVMIDMPDVVNALTARSNDVIGNQSGRDIGIQLSGALIKNDTRTIVDYKLGIFNGSGINIPDTANNAKDVAGRLVLYPFKKFSIGAAYYNGWAKAIDPEPEYIGRSQPRNRIGAELAWNGDRLSILAEYMQGTDGIIDHNGYYIFGGYYFIPEKFQLTVRLDTYNPNLSASGDRTTNYALGINIFFNKWSKLQSVYTFREEESNSSNNNYFSTQLQVRF